MEFFMFLKGNISKYIAWDVLGIDAQSIIDMSRSNLPERLKRCKQILPQLIKFVFAWNKPRF